MLNVLPPAEVEYTKIPDVVIDGVPYKKGGIASRAKVTIQPEYEGDVGILKHELWHVVEFEMWILAALVIMLVLILLGFGLLAWLAAPLVAGHSIAIRVSRSYAIWVEASAYRRQMRYPDKNGSFMSADSAAERLASPVYGFGLTKEEALNYFK